MSKGSTDRNLLVGILALQMEFIDHVKLINAMQAWIFQKPTNLEDLLHQQQAINQETREFLKAMAEKHIQLHDNDAGKSIAALSSVSSVRKRLHDLKDSEVDQSLSRIADRRANDATQIGSGHADADGTTRILNSAEDSGNRRFKILRPHAMGGLGQVSVAEDTELHREVALKEIQDRFSGDHISRERFMMEAEVTGRLEHPGIVPVYSLGRTESGAPFYVMRFIQGDSLKEAIDRLHNRQSLMSAGERLSALRKLIRRLVDVCNAIEYAHSRGVLHRDLKPGNIMLGKYGETLVVDWGLAKTVGKKGAHEVNDEVTLIPLSGEGSTETRMGTVVGTLAFMSPEQAEGRLDALGPQSDVYCLGATLYSCLTGHSPIAKAAPENMLADVRSGRFPKPSQIDGTVPRALEAVCLKAMSLRAEDRYSSAAALAEELELWLADEPVSAYPEPWTQGLTRWSKRHRAVVGTAVGMLTVSTSALLIVNGLVSKQNSKLRQKNDEIEQSRSVIQSQRDSLQENKATLADLSLGVLTAAESGLKNTPGADEFRSNVMERSFETFKLLYEQDKTNHALGTSLAQAARLSANQLSRIAQRPAAADRMRMSIELQKDLLDTAQDQALTQNYLAESLRDLGSTLRAIGKLHEARDAFAEALGILGELQAADPTRIAFRRTSASIDLTQAGLLIDLMEYESAEILAERGAAVLVELSAGKDSIPTDHIFAMLAIAWHGRSLDLTARHDEARAVFADGIARGRAWMQGFPNDLSTEYSYARLLHWDADGVSMTGEVSDDRIQNLDDAIRMCEKLRAAAPLSVGFMYNLGDALKTRARIFRIKMQYDLALECLRKSEVVLQVRLKAEESADSLDILSETLHEVAETQLATGDIKSATGSLGAAIEHLAKASGLSPENQQVKRKRRQLEELLASVSRQIQN